MAFGENAMIKSGVLGWRKRFKKGREDVTGDPRSVPKATMTEVNATRVRNTLTDD